jgi:hypothetical protein
MVPSIGLKEHDFQAVEDHGRAQPKRTRCRANSKLELGGMRHGTRWGTGDCGSDLRSRCMRELGRGGSTKLQPTSTGRRPWRQGKKGKISARVTSESAARTDAAEQRAHKGGACQDMHGGEEVACVSRRSAGHRGAGPRHGHDAALTSTCAMRGGQRAS